MTTQNNEQFIFAEEKIEILEDEAPKDLWTVLIVDDNVDVHETTKFVLKDFQYNNKKLHFLDAYSAIEAKKILENTPVDVILLDVVMETDYAGLELVTYIRKELQDAFTRIIVRTGQPGLAPEKSVITEYDINDYRQKSETISADLYSSIVIALRTLTSLRELDFHRKKQEDLAKSLIRFIPQSSFKILKKNDISQIKIGDYIDKYISILFLDIRAFTSMSEFLLPVETFKFINECMSYIGPIIIKNNGFIDKFIGDALMALFPGKIEEIINAGIQISKAIQEFNNVRLEKDQMPIKIGIGINTGLVVVGTVGYDERMDCTAISDSVNMAARVEKLNKHFGTNLLISEDSFNSLKNQTQYLFRYLGRVKLPGKKIVPGIYEIYNSDSDDVIALKNETMNEFNRAVKLFYSNELTEAHDLFKHILTINPHDSVSRYFLADIERIFSSGFVS